MNQDTVASSMAKQLGIQKGAFFDKEATESMAVKLASSETLIIQQTKQWLKDVCSIDFDSVDRNKCKRSYTTLLVKNIAASVKESELREVFERYGALTRLFVSPFNTLAIIEYTQASQAEAAMRNLAYYKINHLMPMYLEYAPVGTLSKPTDQKHSESEDVAMDDVQSR